MPKQTFNNSNKDTRREINGDHKAKHRIQGKPGFSNKIAAKNN